MRLIIVLTKMNFVALKLNLKFAFFEGVTF